MVPRFSSQPPSGVRVALVAALVLVAGCSAIDADGTTTTTHSPEAGYITAEPAASVPANETVVSYSSDAVGDSAKLQTALERAVDQNQSVHVSLTGEEIGRVESALDAHVYVRYRGTVVRVLVAKAA